jgi:hypothetical protein
MKRAARKSPSNAISRIGRFTSLSIANGPNGRHFFQNSDVIRPSPSSKHQKKEIFFSTFLGGRIFRSTDSSYQRDAEGDWEFQAK